MTDVENYRRAVESALNATRLRRVHSVIMGDHNGGALDRGDDRRQNATDDEKSTFRPGIPGTSVSQSVTQ